MTEENNIDDFIQQAVNKGYEESIKNHTWNSRGEKILKILESVLAK